MGAAAGGERRAVAAHEIDRLGLDAEMIRHHLPEARFVALPARLRSHDQIDAFGRHFDRDALVRHPDRGLDIIGHPDPEQPSTLFRRPAAGRKAVPVGGGEHARKVAGEIAAVVVEPGRRAMRQLVAPDQVAATQFDTIDVEPARRDVDEPLHHRSGFRPPGAANGAVGTVLVMTPRNRTHAAGTS